MRRPFLSVLALAVLSGLIPTRTAAAQNPAWYQTFTSPSVAMFLQAISIGGQESSANVRFDIFATAGTAVGPSLFNESVGPLLRENVTTLSPGILLLPNTIYALGVSNVGSGQLVDDYFTGGRVYLSSNAGGVFTLREDLGTDLSTKDFPNFSVVFSATAPATGPAVIHAPVTGAPEPSSIVLFATGFATVAGVAARRRHRIS